MNYHAILQALRPDAIPNEDFVAGEGGFKWFGREAPPTIAEIEAAWPAVQVAMAAEAAARKKDDDQRRAGVVEAKRAYTRLQTIIDGADTATVAQMRTAIKQIAIDVQHLIRAAVR